MYEDMCEAIRDLRNDAKIEGKKEEALTIAKNLIALGSNSFEEIAKITGLTLEEVRSLAKENTI